jgi:hypothetical protein
MDAAGALALKNYIVLRRSEGFVKVRAQEPDADYDHSSLPLIDAFVQAYRDSRDEEERTA